MLHYFSQRLVAIIAMLSKWLIQLMSCGNMAGMESLYIQLSEEIASKSNKEWKVQTGATYRILWQNVFYQMICPKAPVTTGINHHNRKWRLPVQCSFPGHDRCKVNCCFLCTFRLQELVFISHNMQHNKQHASMKNKQLP